LYEEKKSYALLAIGPPDMTSADDIERLEREIGERIDAAVRADPRSQVAIAAALGLTAGALQKIQDGKSTTQFAKLAQLAAVLHKSPNELLGLDGRQREALTGALQGAFEGLGYDPPGAQELAAIVLKVICTHESDGRSPSPQEPSLVIAKFLAQQFVDSQRK
jgi:transcriptional regulator with XRE-family HTH domain